MGRPANFGAPAANDLESSGTRPVPSIDADVLEVLF